MVFYDEKGHSMISERKKGYGKLKIIIDICMTVLLFILMAYHYVGVQWHEMIGTVMLVLFVLHHILNGNWYLALRKGKYKPGRIFLTVIDMLLLIDMFLLMSSGIAMSRHVFRFLNIPVSMAWARGTHMTAAYAGFLLMGFHIGIHYGMIMRMTRKAFWADTADRCENNNAVWTWVFRVITVFIALYGVYALQKREFIDYISQKVQFVFFDFNEMALSFFLDYAAIMILTIFISYYFQRFLQRGR